MPAVPKRVLDRMRVGLKKFQPILASARSRDVNESDTVVIIADMLEEIFGYDKYAEITSEHMIRGTFCDLAIKLDNKLSLLIEVKAIGIDLKEKHVKQAVDYAVNQGTEWVALTNGREWRVYKVVFSKPIEKQQVVRFITADLNPRKNEDLEIMGLLSKTGWRKSAITAFHSQQEALSRFTLGALIMSDKVVDVLRREVRRVAPEVKISSDQVRDALINEVLKREVIEGDQAKDALKTLSRASNRMLRNRKKKPAASDLAADLDDV